ncbi:hypothetical protein ACEPAI_9058 [Sanghuangporus weigelae]
MSLYYYEPFFSLDDFQRLFDDFFDRSTDRPVSERQVARREESGQRSLARGFQPRMDIREASDQNLVTATFELPGMTKENVQIDVQPGRLTVSGEQTVSNDVDEKGYVHRERRYGRFERSLPLPSGTKPTDIKAAMENGVLSVTFPKTSPEQVPQRITIA